MITGDDLFCKRRIALEEKKLGLCEELFKN